MRVILLLKLLFLTSCGLQPIYKNQSHNSNQIQNYELELASIKVEIDRKKLNIDLKNNLESILNPNNINIEPKYIISLRLEKDLAGTFITSTGSSGRYKVILKASYKLKNLESDEVISTGFSTVNDDFDVEDKRFANYIAEEQTANNLILILAKEIRGLLLNDIVNNTKDPL